MRKAKLKLLGYLEDLNPYMYTDRENAEYAEFIVLDDNLDDDSRYALRKEDTVYCKLENNPIEVQKTFWGEVIYLRTDSGNDEDIFYLNEDFTVPGIGKAVWLSQIVARIEEEPEVSAQ